jgi:hypothetical protein
MLDILEQEESADALVARPIIIRGGLERTSKRVFAGGVVFEPLEGESMEAFILRAAAAAPGERPIYGGLPSPVYLNGTRTVEFAGRVQEREFAEGEFRWILEGRTWSESTAAATIEDDDWWNN